MKILISFLAGVIVASGTVVGVRTATQPHCPEEDSCQVDYSHGHWSVTEVQP